MDIEKLIEAKALQDGYTTHKSLSIIELINHIGSRKKYDNKDLERSFLTEKSLIPNNDSIAFNIHPMYVNLGDHSHEFIEMNYMYRGSCKQVINYSNEIVLNKGDLLILENGVCHRVLVNDGADDLIINCIISKRYFENYLLGNISSNILLNEISKGVVFKVPSKNFQIFHTAENDNIRKYFEKCILEFFNREICYENVVSAYLNLIFSELCRGNYTSDLQNESYLTSEIISYITDNYSSTSLNDVARQFHFSPNYLTKYLKKELHKTFIEILQEIRIGKGYSLLINTDKSIREISEMVGYDNVYYFTQLFYKKYNAMPSNIRTK